jgi:hypothetical protein
MRAFDDRIIDLLRPELGVEPIHYVGLGSFDFQFAFGKLLRVQNMQRVDFRLQDVEYTWEEGPCAIPAWLLVGQIPNDVTLESSTTLRMTFSSGDWVRLHTEDGPYESQIFEWTAPNQDAIVAEIY